MNNINAKIKEDVSPAIGESASKESEILILEIGCEDQHLGIYSRLHKDGCGY